MSTFQVGAELSFGLRHGQEYDTPTVAALQGALEYPFPFLIGDLAVRPPKGELVTVALKVLLADVVERAVDAPLEQREITLSGVRVNPALAYPLAAVVLYGVMPTLEAPADAPIGLEFIREDGGTRYDGFLNNPLQGIGLDGWEYPADSWPLT